jgi:hypothetical protein
MYPARVAFLFVLHILGLFGYIPCYGCIELVFSPPGVWMLDPTRLNERAPWEEIQLAYLLDVLCKKGEGRWGGYLSLSCTIMARRARFLGIRYTRSSVHLTARSFRFIMKRVLPAV